MKKILLFIFLVGCSQTPISAKLNKTDTNYSFNNNDILINNIEDTIEDSSTEEDIIDDSLQDDLNIVEQDDAGDDSTETVIAEDTNDVNNIDIQEPKDVKKCLDDDGDGFGNGCDLGADCDDYNPNFTTYCPDCSKQNYAGCSCKVKSESCYSADPATANVGECKKGTQLCTKGFWEACKGEVTPAQEVCNNKDDDCDGETDEGVKSSCGTCDLTCIEKSVGVKDPIILNSENSSGVGIDVDTGAIKIDSTQISLKLKFLWASNSSENTVSKVDCKTIKEVGRYKVCNNPSRTSVNLDGDVFVACRGDGRVAKIIADKKNCFDKNNNGVIETAEDINNDGNISANEMVANDECIAYIVQPLGQASSYPGARGAAVDKYNNVYIGYWKEANVAYLDGKTGATLKVINWQCPTYGLVVDQKGTLWGQGSGCGSLMSYNPTSGQWNNASSYSANGISAYGINVDGKGRIWVGGSLARYNPADGTWKKCGISCAGIATANDGAVWLARDGSGIGKVDGDTCTSLGTVNTGGSPHGCAVDFDGYVWGVNLGGGSVDKIDPGKTGQMIGQLIGSRGIGYGPYTYSDMTGYTLNYFTAPKGLYTTTFFATGGSNPVSQVKPKAVWTTLIVDAQLPPTTKVHIRIRSADTKDQLENSNWIDLLDLTDMAQMPFDLTQQGVTGIMMQVELNLITEDKKVSPLVSSVTAKAKMI